MKSRPKFRKRFGTVLQIFINVRDDYGCYDSGVFPVIAEKENLVYDNDQKRKLGVTKEIADFFYVQLKIFMTESILFLSFQLIEYSYKGV